jgi:hypothetical protein
MACKRLIRLSSINDINAFYKRIDYYIDRNEFTSYTEPAYCWTWWTKICMKHKSLAIVLILGALITYNAYRKLKLYKD